MKRIKLIATTATLAAQSRNRLEMEKYTPRLSGLSRLGPADMIAALPELAQIAQVEPDRDYYPSSPDEPRIAGVKYWRLLTDRISELLDDPTVDGVVVTHGTNVLEETAYFLHLTLKSEKPVVVVGAQRPWSALSSDGPLNLYNAVRVAIDDQARGMGVLVVLNDEIQCARDVTKTNTYRVHTFRSQDFGILGYTDGDRITWYRAPLRRHTTQTEFHLPSIEAFPRVDILYTYCGDDGALVEAARQLGARGLVIAGSGAGAVNDLEPALIRAANEGVVVVRSNRVGTGRVITECNYHRPGFVAADTLNPQKARVLLLLALTQSSDPAEIQRMFDTY